VCFNGDIHILFLPVHREIGWLVLHKSRLCLCEIVYSEEAEEVQENKACKHWLQKVQVQ